MPDIYSEVSAKSDARREKNDCSVKAVAIVCGVSYEQAHEKLSMLGRCAGQGVYDNVISQAIRGFGFTLLNAPEFRDKLGIKTTKAFDEFLVKHSNHPLTKHTYLIKSHRHITAVRNGRVQDWAVGRLKRIKNVYLVAPKHAVEDA